MSSIKLNTLNDPLHVPVDEVIDQNAQAEKARQAQEFREVAPVVETSATPPASRNRLFWGIRKLISGQN